MDSIFEKLNVRLRNWLWKRKNTKNEIRMVRDLFPNDRLTFFPYESDYKYLITEYCWRNTPMFRGYAEPSYVFKLHMNNGEVIVGFPVQLTKNLLTLRKEQSKPDGYHVALDEEFTVYLFDIDHISAVRTADDFHAIYVDAPIFGYKSIEESDGKLYAKGHTYRLNEPNVLETRNPYNTDFQDCYFHFCTSMEGVALCPGPTSYLNSIKNFAKGRAVFRLFRVKAEGHCISRNDDLDWWVTNKITVLEEVSKEEIYQYYMENPRARELVAQKEQLPPTFWDEFLKSKITPYVEK